MKVLVDMNLSPQWVEVLQRHGLESTHWVEVGDVHATDTEIMTWARDRGYIVFTHDLDFGTMLALTRASGPSVLQVRTQDVLPQGIELVVVTALKEHSELLEKGALVSVNKEFSRVRILPINQ